MAVFKLEQSAKDVQRAVENALYPDTTLSQSGQLADAKSTGDLIRSKGDSLFFDTDTNLLFLVSDGQIIGDGVKVAAGGSGGTGGSSNNAVMTLKNESGWLYKNIALNSKCALNIDWSSVEEGISTGSGVLTVKVGGVLKHSASVEQGSVEVEVGEYLSAGNNSVRVSVSDVYGNSRTLAFTINSIALTMASSFDSDSAYSGDIVFPYTPTGAVEKTVYFVLDGKEIGQQTVKESGRQQTFTIPAQEHGSHTLLVYFTTMIDGEEVPSNSLFYDITCWEEGNTKPVIASSFRDDEAEQFVPVSIDYRVVDPSGLTATVALIADGVEQTTLIVDRTTHTWSYRPDGYGNVHLEIKCTGASGEVTVKEFTINVAESKIGAIATTNDLELHLSAYGRNNNESDPSIWENNGIRAELTGFNFKSDGWQLDENKNTVLRVAGDARVHIPFNIFAQDFRTTGKTIEIEFASRDVLNYDAVMITCMSGGRGLEITTQKAMMTSEQSAIGTQYKEEEHVRLSFVVEKKSENKLLLCYINGILSGVAPYPEDDDFSQQNPVGITIGNNDCTTDIYCIRVYNNDLTRYQILDNWIADTQVGIERKERYDRNNVYDEYGSITPNTLKKDLPYLILNASVLPQFKGDKKTCSGEYVDPVNPEKSFTFENAEIDVQGTSSQYYYVKNYKIKFKGGFILYNGETVEVYYLNDNVVPTDTYTFKADVASSEGANNVVLARLYNDLCPVETAPQKENDKVRQTIDGHPIVIFWNNGAETKFIGKYNFNHDKGTEEIFGFKTGDESWEILQNGTDRVGFKSADFSGSDWKNDFEARYPEDNENVTKLKALSEWLVSTNTESATGVPIVPVTYGGVEYTADTVEYRLAKFKAELANHANVDALVFYYVFTDLFLCIDQREKNAFPTLFAKDPKWLMLFYDADSSLGTDNKGNLAFDYYLEDIDYTEAGDPIFNGQGSVLWVNLRNAFYSEIEAEYKRLRTTIRNDGSGKPLLSYDVVDDMFESHQGKWSEAIYNEDGNRKSIEPFVLNGDGLYLPMAQGKKEQHRKWWLYNRFRYKDSQFNTGSSMEKRITIRVHAQGNIKLTSYVNMYGHVYYNAEMAEHRMFRGQEYEFEWAATGAEDAVIGINDADMLTDIGDLSPLMVELIDISKAIHLTSLKVGDASEDYVNNNLNSITLGNNVLLRTLDLRNCASLTQAVNASGCTGLEEAYFDGTAITSLTLPNGGNVKKLHLPESITNLTLMNQTALTEFVIPSYANVTTLRLENNNNVIDPLAILNQIPANSRVRIIGFSAEYDNYTDFSVILDKLDAMRGLDENGNNTDKAQVSGTVHISNLTGNEMADIKTRYPSITVTYDTLVSYLYFYNEDGSELLYTDTVQNGGNGMYVGNEVTKESTAQYNYELAGWSKTIGGAVDADALANVVTNRNVYAVFTATVRTYTVRFMNDDVVLESHTVPYGGSATYTGDDPVKGEDYAFIGWNPVPNNVTEDMDCYAQFKSTTIVSRKLIDRTITVYKDDTVESVRSYAFSGCISLTTVDMKDVTSISNWAFNGCSKLTTFILRDTDKITNLGGNGAFISTPIASGNGYIYVPAALVDSYKAATNWSSFATKFRTIEDYPDICGGGN